MRRRIVSAAATATLIIGVAGLVALVVGGGSPQPRTTASTAPARPNAAERVDRVVVGIEVRGSAGPRLASATVYRDQYLITAARLVAGADSIWAVPVAGDVVEASVVGVDSHTDLAVLRVDGSVGPAPRLRRSPLRTGGVVTVMTGPGPDEGATSARITAVDRRERIPDGVDLYGAARVDVPPRPELTGAALLDRAGRVVGVVNAMAFEDPPSHDRSTVVLPAAVIAAVADAIIETGTASHAWLGVTVEERPGDDSSPCREGVVVSAVRPGSPAQRAGIKPDDRLAGLGSRATATVSAVMAALRMLEPGDTTAVRVCSAGTTATRPVVVAASPAGE